MTISISWLFLKNTKTKVGDKMIAFTAQNN